MRRGRGGVAVSAGFTGVGLLKLLRLWVKAFRMNLLYFVM